MAFGGKSLQADAIIDASGTWFKPNPAGANGLAARGETAEAVAVHLAYGMPDVLGAARARYAPGKRVAVLGAGHSAVGTLIDLVRLAEAAPATKVSWLIRGDNPAKAFGGGANDALAARGALGSLLAKLVSEHRITIEAAFRVSDLAATQDGLRIGAGSACCGRSIIADELIVATGFRPDPRIPDRAADLT